MGRTPIKILLQTTITPTEDNWSIARFSQLAKLLAAEVGDDDQALYEVTARDRGPLNAPDSVLSTLDKSDFDQLWLLAHGDCLSSSWPTTRSWAAWMASFCSLMKAS